MLSADFPVNSVQTDGFTQKAIVLGGSSRPALRCSNSVARLLEETVNVSRTIQIMYTWQLQVLNEHCSVP